LALLDIQRRGRVTTDVDSSEVLWGNSEEEVMKQKIGQRREWECCGEETIIASQP
jgi:hypothetical protein